MHYFGEPIDVLDHLSVHVNAGADNFTGEVREATQFLADELAKLSALYEELVLYAQDDDATEDSVINAYRRIVKNELR